MSKTSKTIKILGRTFRYKSTDSCVTTYRSGKWMLDVGVVEGENNWWVELTLPNPRPFLTIWGGGKTEAAALRSLERRVGQVAKLVQP